MEDSYSVNSPRRVLSLSKKRRAILSFHDQDDKGFGFQPLEERGLKSSEVYGFVGSITTIVATAIFFVWAYVPEPWLHSIGIYYYPSRYWALAAPIYTIMAIVLGLLFYIGLNFMSTPPPTSLNTIYDEFSREPSDIMHSMEEEVQMNIQSFLKRSIIWLCAALIPLTLEGNAIIVKKAVNDGMEFSVFLFNKNLIVALALLSYVIIRR